MNGMSFFVDAPDGSVRVNVTGFYTSTEFNALAVHERESKIAIVRAQPFASRQVPDGSSMHLIRELFSVIPIDNTTTVWYVVDDRFGVGGGYIRPSDYHGSHELECAIRDFLNTNTGGSYCLYDQYGAIEAKLPASALALKDCDKAVAGTITDWNIDWLVSTILSAGDEYAGELAEKLVAQDMCLLDMILRDNLMYCVPEALLHNFDTLSLGMVESPMDKNEYDNARLMISEVVESARFDAVNLENEDERPSSVYAAIKVAKRLGRCDYKLSLYDKLVKTAKKSRDIVRIWRHCTQTANSPIAMNDNVSRNVGKYDKALTQRVGEAFGVAGAMKSYADGVPIEDIVA